MSETRGNETMRFVSWNLNWRATSDERDRQLELIDELDADLLVLQEMKETTLRPIRERFDWCVFALGPRPDDRSWKAKIGTAVLGRGGAQLLSQMAIAPTWFDLPDDLRWKANRFSRRALWAEVSWQGSEPFLVGSLHASPAAGDIGKHKPWFHAGAARWLADRPGTLDFRHRREHAVGRPSRPSAGPVVLAAHRGAPGRGRTPRSRCLAPRPGPTGRLARAKAGGVRADP